MHLHSCHTIFYLSTDKVHRTMNDLFSRWFIPTSQSSLLTAQSALLSYFVKSEVHARQLRLARSQNHINYIELRRKGISDSSSGSSSSGGCSGSSSSNDKDVSQQKTLVLMHGLGCGLGFFFSNYDHLLQHYDRVYALDWIGMGGSSRPNFPARSIMSDIIDRLNGQELKVPFGIEPLVNTNIRESTDFFIDAFEEFRETMKIRNFTLAGHSLGGFLSAKYCIKYPDQVKNLALISPVGLPSPPPRDNHAPVSTSMSFLRAAWANNVTPMSILRVAGPRGKNYTKDMLDRRFRRERANGTLKWERHEVDLISEYLYHITVAKASGELAMNSLLMPVFYRKHDRLRGGVFAREPVLDDVARTCCQHNIKLLVQFGDNDWLHYDEAAQDIEYINKKYIGCNAKLDIIEAAGHHLYIENPIGFYKSLKDWDRH